MEKIKQNNLTVKKYTGNGIRKESQERRKVHYKPRYKWEGSKQRPTKDKRISSKYTGSEAQTSLTGLKDKVWLERSKQGTNSQK